MKDNEMDPKIENTLDVLRSVPPRDPGAAARGKAYFLKQASVMRSAVSRKQETRHNGWINTIFPVFPRKEHRVMNAMIAVVVAVVIFFGGTGTTVYAAQASLPDQPLYPLKTWSEDTLLLLTGSPQSRINYALDFSGRRITEMASLLSAGRPIPEMTMTRLQNELQQALELAAGMDDPQMAQQLEQIRLRIETQLKTMTALISQAQESPQPVLLQTQLRLQDQVRLCMFGLTDPQGFRLHVQQRQQNRDGMQIPTGTPMPTGNGYCPGPGNGLQTPVGMPLPTGNSNGSGQFQPTGTAGQYGPGPQSPTQPPQSGNGKRGPATQEPASTPMPTGNSNGPGSEGNQPTGTPGQFGPSPHSPSQTLQPGSGSGNGP
jgi:hypothetical protein